MNHADPIVRRIHACVLAFVPVCLWSEPGAGKTARVMAYGKARGLHLERFLLSRCEPIDLKPRIVVDGAVQVVDCPERSRLTAAGGGILFYDELNRATREVEGAALDTIDNPPPGVAVIAACNPPSRGQAARSLESAAANRFCHLDVAHDAEAYASALLSGWSTDAGNLAEALDPVALDRATHAARALGSAFLRRRPEALSKEPADPVSAGKAWPSPRSWDHALRLYAVARVLKLDADDQTALLAGCVGGGPAVEFLAFCLDSEIDPEELLANPSAWKPPTGRVDKTLSALAQVVSAVKANLTDDRWKAAWALLVVADNAGQADAVMVCTTSLLSISRGVKGLTHAHKLMPARAAKLLAAR